MTSIAFETTVSGGSVIGTLMANWATVFIDDHPKAIVGTVGALLLRD